MQDTEIDAGQPLEMSCKIEGIPKSVKWLKNGVEVQPDDRIKFVSLITLTTGVE